MQPGNPFHSGEIEAQRRAGAGDVASQVAGFIRDYLPEQHREFHTSLPFLVAAAADDHGQPWVTLLDGEDGFITSPTDTSLEIRSKADRHDPLAGALKAGTDIGLLGIEFATRRRNRLSGFVRQTEDRYVVDIRQTFGNCPQYIHQRDWRRVSSEQASAAARSNQLSKDQIDRIRGSDTLFIGTGQRSNEDTPSNGYDASHRGGAPGFVEVVDSTHLRIPDYAGNNFFNSIGNLLRNPRIGLLFVDFASGDLLHLTGRAEVDWDPEESSDPGALRMINVAITAVVDRPKATSLRWSADAAPTRDLTVIRKESESDQITSFYLAAADGQELRDFEPGQHLPIQLRIPGRADPIERSYSLSGPSGRDFYRLSVKREPKGMSSRFLHDQVSVGDVIVASNPAGDFVIPCGQCPLVLVSAGVGLTPMISMLHAAASQHGDRPVWFVHGARNSQHHALRSEVDQLVSQSKNVQQQVFYSQPTAADRLAGCFDREGRLSTAALLELGAGNDAHYMLCGPAPLVSSLQSGLETAGVPPAQIHFETF